MASEKIVYKEGLEVHFSLDEKDTNKQLVVFKCIIPPKSRVPVRHYHKKFDETVYGLRGVTTYFVDGKTLLLNPGDTIFIPRGVVHGFVNKSKETTEFICYINPGIFGAAYFRDLAEVINKKGLPDVDKIMEIMKRDGLVPVIDFKHALLFTIVRIIRFLKNKK